MHMYMYLSVCNLVIHERNTPTHIQTYLQTDTHIYYTRQQTQIYQQRMSEADTDRGKEGKNEGEKEKESETDRHTDRQRQSRNGERETTRERGRQTDRQRQGQMYGGKREN